MMKDYSHLRLVRAPIGCESLPNTIASKLALNSVNFTDIEIHGELLMDHFLSLTHGESIAFEHRFLAGRDTNSYGLHLRLESAADSHEAFAKRTSAAMKLACPAFDFDLAQVGAGQSWDEDGRLAHAWEIRLAPVLLAERAGTGALAGANVAAATAARIPCPIEMPSGGLDTDLLRSQCSGIEMELSLRVGTVALSLAQCLDLAKIKHRMDAGLLQAFHPDSLYLHQFAANGNLLEASQTILDGWLRHPDRGVGWVLFVRASERLSPVALRNIGKAFWGKRPIQIQGASLDQYRSPVALSLLDAVLPGQGLPRLFPSDSCMELLGLKAHFSPPRIKPPTTGGAIIGQTVCGKDSSSVVLPARDRFSHTSIFGASGSGKSTFLLNLLAQDLADPARPGIGLIDPHGTLYQDALRLIPQHRMQDVVLVDVTDSSHVSAINPLAGMAEDSQFAHFIANEVVALIEVLFEGSDTTGPMTRNNIKSALLLASNIRGRDCSFLDAARAVDEKDFRDSLLAQCSDSKLKAYWENFVLTTGETGYTNWLPYVQARLRPFTDSPLMRRMLNSPSREICLDQCVAEGKIVFFNLSTATLGSTEARIFGNLMLNRIFYAAMRRSKRPGAKLKPFHLIVDEAASMVSQSTVRLWAEARKFGLSLTTANQSISQLQIGGNAGAIAKAMLANTATKVFFRLSPSDSSALESYASPEFSAGDLTRLPVFHSVVSMSSDGQILPAFVSKVQRPSVDPKIHAKPRALVKAARKRYSTPIGAVAEKLAQIYELPESSFRTLSDQAPPTPAAAQSDAASSAAVVGSPKFVRFAQTMEEQVARWCGAKWASGMAGFKNIVRWERYYDPFSEVEPSYETVLARIQADDIGINFRTVLVEVLRVVRPKLWAEPNPVQSGSEA